MKKLLTFIPLGIGISSAIIYVINVVNYKMVNNSLVNVQILSNLRVYLYISIAGFLFYFLIRLIFALECRKTNITKEEKVIIKETPIIKTEIKEVIITGNKYCDNCGEKIFDTDKYCKRCGRYQEDRKSGINPIIKNIINVLEIVILILIIYFSLNMLFDYKEKIDPNFKSPFKVSMTK